MINQSIRNIALSGLMTLLVIGLVVHLAGQTVAPVLAQDGGTATSTPEASLQDSSIATTTSEICSIDPTTGERTCSQIVVPAGTIEIINTEPADNSGVSGQACETDSQTGEVFCSEELDVENNVSSVQVPNDGSFTLSANFLNVNNSYSLVVSRSSSATGIGFQNNCTTATQTKNTERPPQGRFYNYSYNFTVKTCAAAQTTITAKLKQGNQTLRTKTWTFTATAAPTSTSTPTSTPVPTSTPTTPSNPAIPATPDAPSDVRGHWDVNLAPGKFSGSYTYYGYQTRLIGAVSSDTFEYEGVTYTVTFFKWDQSANEITFKLDKCLKPSAFSGLRVGDLTFDEIDDDAYTDSQCESNSGRDQRFDFDVSTNPLPTGSAVRVTLLLKLPDPFVITADPEFPSAGESVTLTVPSPRMTYQWQQWSGGQWTNLGSETTVASKDVSFSTRGTRKFRAVASTGSGLSIETPAIYVTWDEFEIVSEMLGAVATNVTSTTAFTTAQSSLVTCVNREVSKSYSTFYDILEEYTGATKTAVDGSCSQQSTAMFDAFHTAARAELKSLKSNNAEYAALLDSDYYSGLTEVIGHPRAMKRNSHILASSRPSTSTDSGSSSGNGGAGGTSSTDNPPGSSQPTTGLACLPSATSTPPTLMSTKMTVLNCLTVDTPRTFWEGQATLPTLRTAIENNSNYNTWLGIENWDCSMWFDAPIASCLAHDVAWDSLRKFEGGKSNDVMDVAWNPRNKYFADELFYADIKKNGCYLPSAASWLFCRLSRSVDQAFIMQIGVRSINTKQWVYTEYDEGHIEANPRFAEYRIPSVKNVTVSKPGNRKYRVNWTFDSGTVSDVSVSQYRICWTLVPRFLGSDEVCKVTGGNSTTYTYTKPLLGQDVVALKSIGVSPDKRMNLGSGRYYPAVILDRTYD